MAAAAALEAHLLRQSADNHHVRILGNREYPVVFQQNRAFTGKLLGNFVGIRRILLFSVVRRVLFHQLFDYSGGLGDVGFRDFSCLERCFQLPGVDSVAVRHFQVHARLHGLCQIRAGAPVGNDHPVKTPFLPENFREQVTVFTGVVPVQAVVGRHHRGGTRRFHHVFKGAEVNLPQGAFVDLAVGRLPVGLLVVGREMLEGNRHVLPLGGADIGRAQPPGQEGVFAEILKISAAQRGALHVDARP